MAGIFGGGGISSSASAETSFTGTTEGAETQTLSGTIATATNRSYSLTGTLVGRAYNDGSAAPETASFTFNALVENNAGTVSVIYGATASANHNPDSWPAPVLFVDGTSVKVSATGQAPHTITWAGSLHTASAGQPTWSPETLSSLFFWADNDVLASLPDGEEIANWHDRSSKGYGASQTTSANRPHKQTVNGIPVVRFVFAASERFGWTVNTTAFRNEINGAAGITGAVVFQYNDTLNTPWFNFTGSGAPAYRIFCDDSSGTRRVNVAARRAVGDSTTTATATIATPSQFQIAIARVNYATGAVSLYLNNGSTAAATATLGGSVGNLAITLDNSFIGANGSLFAQGDAASMLLCNSALSDGNIASLMTYLRTRYSALPVATA